MTNHQVKTQLPGAIPFYAAGIGPAWEIELMAVVSHWTALHLKQAPPLRSGRGPVAEIVTSPGWLGWAAR